MRKTVAKKIRKVSILIAPKKLSWKKVYRRAKKGYLAGRLHMKTINHILQNNRKAA